VRYDTTASFTHATSWVIFDVKTINSGLTGFWGAACVTNAVILVPGMDAATYLPHFRPVKYDTTQDFLSTSSYTWYDLTSDFTPITYYGVCVVGNFVYFSPYGLSNTGGTVTKSTVLRYDSAKPLHDWMIGGAWTASDLSQKEGIDAKGFWGCVSDGQFVYFIPHYNDVAYHGKTVRFNNSASIYYAPGSWVQHDIEGTNGLPARGYRGGVFDGKYVYYAVIEKFSS